MNKINIGKEQLKNILGVLFFLIFNPSYVLAYDVEIGGIYYNLEPSAKTAEVTYEKYREASYNGTIIIPEKIVYNATEYRVISIGPYSFFNCSELYSIILPNSITIIDSYAFFGCLGLASISLPNHLNSIGNYALAGCARLTSISFPIMLTTIGEGAFFECGKIEKISIPDGVKKIGSNAFGRCTGVISVTIPSSITNIEDNVFLECTSMTSITLSNCITTIGNNAFSGCKKLSSINVPNSVTSIGKHAFEGCTSLKSVNLPEKLSNIADYIFNGCSSLNSLTIPNNIYSIGEAAFQGCSSLTDLIIPNSVYLIDKYAFWNCSSLISIVLSNNIKVIRRLTFANCEILKFITIPDGVTAIEELAFSGCISLTSVTIPSSVCSIGKFAFQECIKLKNVYSLIEKPFDISEVFKDISSLALLQVPTGTKSLYQNIPGWSQYFKEIVEFDDSPVYYALSITASGNGSATYGSTAIRNNTRSFTVNEGSSAAITFTPDDGYRIKSVKVNNSSVSVSNNQCTISIGANTTVSVEFEAIPPTTYTLSVTASGNGSATYSSTAIRNNTRSFTVNEGTSATIIFSPEDGNRIKTVKVNNSTVSVSNNQYTISSINANTTVEVEFEEIPVSLFSVDGFYYKVIEDKTNEVELIQNEVYKSYTGDLIIPETVTYNGRSYKITSIGKSAFFNCSGFTGSLSIPSSVTSIGESAFSMCSGFTGSLSIPSSVTFIGGSAFNECRGFTGSLTIPNTVSSIGINTFRSCGFTGSLVIPNSVTSIGDYAFYGCKGFTGSLTIPNSVSLIGKYSFSSCGFTGSLIIPSSVTSIRESAFSLCSGFTGSLSIPGSVISIGNSAFLGCRGLTSVFIPENVTSIGYSAFQSCNNMILVESQISEPFSIDDNVFQGISSVAELKVPKGTKTKYEAFSGWTCNFNKIHEIGVTDTYTLSITVSGNGFASYDGKTIRGESRSFTVNEGTSVTVSFSPDEGYRVKGVNVNGQSVTVTGNQYTIDNINSDVKIEVVFEMIPVSSLTVDGVKYNVVSNEERTVNVAAGDYGLVLTVPETIEANGLTWKVTGIEDTALNSSPELAAIVWNLDYGFTGNVSNPNLLLYVKSADYAPTAIKNVVVNGVAENIILTDAESGNNFYCPQEFTARSISYEHHYGMTTGIGEARGWETLALPFDVQKVTHATKGDMTPFAKWKSGDAAKPFWLMELSGNRFVETDAIKANTPYIVSMPNNDQYKSEFRMAGTVKFSANNVTVKASDNLTTASYADRTLTPNFVVKPAGTGCYALNVDNELEKNDSGITEGSRFVLNIRQVHPFEAYMTSTSGARYIELFDDDTTDILKLDNLTISQSGNLYDLQGRKVSGDVRKGVYIKKGKKLIIK